ncbi:MAG: nucleoside-diphosphate kinase [Spirochaetes bacterium]|nr:nucleoside-diphosphate kinase [Spirochaetota bacterium]
MKERTLIILKPCCIQRCLSGEVISRFEKKGMKIIGIKMAHLSKEQAEYHYNEHKGKSFFNFQVRHITSNPVILMVLEGDNVIKLARNLTGATNVDEALPGTIRGDFVLHTPINIVHSSDSIINANKEINHFFKEDEIFSYEKALDNWI